MVADAGICPATEAESAHLAATGVGVFTKTVTYTSSSVSRSLALAHICRHSATDVRQCEGPAD